MLYSIIPPILIVLSLIGIIVFLTKKSSALPDLPEEDIFGLADHPEAPEKKTRISGITGKFKAINREAFKHYLLVALEKVAGKFKIFFLKMEALSGKMRDRIRDKRKGFFHHAKNNIFEESQENDIMDRLREYDLKKNQSDSHAPKAIAVAEEEIEKPARPTVSEKVVKPRRVKAEIKDRLEELLIERIAVNPKDIEAYERLGEYYMEIESYEFAKECYKQILKLSPSNRNVKYKMRRLENLLSKK